MRLIPFVRVALLLLLAGGLLSACDPFRNTATQFACPRYGGLDTATRQVKFRPGEGRDLTDVMYIVRLDGVTRTCEYDKNGVSIAMKVNFALELGPANPDRNAAFQYFVAIADENNKVLAKRIFPVALTFPDNVGYVEKSDDIDQQIPLPVGRSASGYQIIVGLQLTEAELEYNRRTEGAR
jgi:hypothetical protein